MCSAFTPNYGYDNSIIILIGDVYCPNTKCSGELCTKRLFNLSAEAIVNIRNARLCARFALFLLEIKRIPFSCHLSRGLQFWKESKINSRWYWRYFLSRQILFQQREKWTSWRLCNNSEIHLWLWKVWSLVVGSQSSFYVTRARKNHKDRQNTLFLC